MIVYLSVWHDGTSVHVTKLYDATIIRLLTPVSSNRLKSEIFSSE